MPLAGEIKGRKREIGRREGTLLRESESRGLLAVKRERNIGGVCAMNSNSCI